MAKGWWCCFCFCCAFVVLFLIIFFPSASPPRREVHNVLQDVVITNLSISDGHTVTTLNCTVHFKVWSRNANKLFGVSVWHSRIAAVYNGFELGRAYVLPRYVHPPRNITILESSFVVSNATLPTNVASRMRQDIHAGFLPLRIYVKVRAKYKRVDHSWRTKLGGGDLRGDDKCSLNVTLSDGDNHLRGRSCGWTVSYYDPNAYN